MISAGSGAVYGCPYLSGTLAPEYLGQGVVAQRVGARLRRWLGIWALPWLVYI